MNDGRTKMLHVGHTTNSAVATTKDELAKTAKFTLFEIIGRWATPTGGYLN